MILLERGWPLLFVLEARFRPGTGFDGRRTIEAIGPYAIAVNELQPDFAVHDCRQVDTEHRDRRGVDEQGIPGDTAPPPQGALRFRVIRRVFFWYSKNIY